MSQAREDKLVKAFLRIRLLGNEIDELRVDPQKLATPKAMVLLLAAEDMLKDYERMEEANKANDNETFDQIYKYFQTATYQYKAGCDLVTEIEKLIDNAFIAMEANMASVVDEAPAGQ